MNSTGTPKFNSSSSGGKKKAKVPKVNPRHFADDYEVRRAEMLESEEYQFEHFSGDDCADMLMRLLQDFQFDDDDADAADAADAEPADVTDDDDDDDNDDDDDDDDA